MVPLTGKFKRSAFGFIKREDIVYVFSGYDGESSTNDLLKFNLKDNSVTSLTKFFDEPVERMKHSTEIIAGKMLVFGGESHNQKLNDL